jgi:hypothetical protein
MTIPKQFEQKKHVIPLYGHQTSRSSRKDVAMWRDLSRQ